LIVIGDKDRSTTIGGRHFTIRNIDLQFTTDEGDSFVATLQPCQDDDEEANLNVLVDLQVNLSALKVVTMIDINHQRQRQLVNDASPFEL
jgi:hypothetical protein